MNQLTSHFYVSKFKQTATVWQLVAYATLTTTPSQSLSIDNLMLLFVTLANDHSSKVSKTLRFSCEDSEVLLCLI